MKTDPTKIMVEDTVIVSRKWLALIAKTLTDSIDSVVNADLRDAIREAAQECHQAAQVNAAK